MGILNKTSVYLAGPIQFTSDDTTWREMVTSRLSVRGIKIFDPLKKHFISSKYQEGKDDQKQMDEWVKEGRLDLVADKMRHIRASDLYQCDIVNFGIFYLNPNIFTVGTFEELYSMNSKKRPCFILWDSDKPCYWLLGMLKPQYIYRTWDKLLETIEEIDDGKKEPDSTRWKLLAEEYR